MAKPNIMAKPNKSPAPTKAARREDEDMEDEDEGPQREPRVAYTAAPESADERNPEGKLTRVPSNFDYTKHLSPKKVDFVDEADFLDFRAVQAETRASDLVNRATRDRETASAIRKYGDPAQRAAIAKRQKLLAEVAALEAGLKASGVELPPSPSAQAA